MGFCYTLFTLLHFIDIGLGRPTTPENDTSSSNASEDNPWFFPASEWLLRRNSIVLSSTSIPVGVFLLISVFFALRVCCQRVKKVIYRPQDWLDKGAHPYMVSFVTGFQTGSGGKPTVSFEIIGSHGRSRRYTACPYYYEDARVFDSRRTDNFLIDTDGSLGTIRKMTMHCVSSRHAQETWYLDRVEIFDMQRGIIWYLPWSHWVVCKDSRFEPTEVVILPVVQSNVRLFGVNLMRGFLRIHLLAQVFRWTPYDCASSATLSLILPLALVLSTMVTVALLCKPLQFLLSNDDDDLSVDISTGRYAAAINVIGILGSIVAWLLKEMNTRRFFSALVAQPGGHARLGCCAGWRRSDGDDDTILSLLSSTDTDARSAAGARKLPSGHRVPDGGKSAIKSYKSNSQTLIVPKRYIHHRGGGDEIIRRHAAMTQTAAKRNRSTASQTSPFHVSNIALQTRTGQQATRYAQVAAPSMTRARRFTDIVHISSLPEQSRIVDLDGAVDVKALIALFSEQIKVPPTPDVKQYKLKLTSSESRSTRTRHGHRAIRPSPAASKNVSSEPFIGVKATIQKMLLAEDVEAREPGEDGGGDELRRQHRHQSRHHKHRHRDNDGVHKDDKEHHHHPNHHHRQQQHQKQQQQQQQQQLPPEENIMNTIKMMKVSLDAINPSGNDDAVDRGHCLRPGDVDRVPLASVDKETKPNIVSNTPSGETSMHGLAKFRQMLQRYRRPEKHISSEAV